MDEMDAIVETVTLEIDSFKAEAIPLFQMPGVMVLEMAGMDPQNQFVRMVQLLRLSIYNPELGAQIEGMSMWEISQLVNMWVDKSNDLERKRGAGTIDVDETMERLKKEREG